MVKTRDGDEWLYSKWSNYDPREHDSFTTRWKKRLGLWDVNDGGNYVPPDREKIYNHLPFEMQYLMANLPFGFGNMTRVQDEVRYWQDYIKNTGKRPLYPGRVVTSNLENSINSVMDWWT